MVREGVLGPLGSRIDTYRLLSMLDAVRRTVVSLVTKPKDEPLKFEDIFENEALWLLPALDEDIDPVSVLRDMVVGMHDGSMGNS